MNPHRWPRSFRAAWSWGVEWRARPARLRRPVVEPMEPRRLLTTIADFPTLTADAGPSGIAAGPDGKIWFTESKTGKIGMIDPSTHATAEFALRRADSAPIAITAGPDGKLWFTEAIGQIGSIDPITDAIVEYLIPRDDATLNPSPQGITAGPDGNVWFTDLGANRVGMINPTTHDISVFATPTLLSQPLGITAAPDGNLWFAEFNANKIASIDPTTHAISEFPIPTARASTHSITAGRDGNLWFDEDGSNKIGSINPVTHDIIEIDLPTANSSPYGITSGPDGNIWFTEPRGNRIGSINPISRDITETTVLTGHLGFAPITAGPDGNLWFTEAGSSKIGVLAPTLAVAVTAEPPDLVTPDTPFGLSISVNYFAGPVDAAYDGNVTLALVTDGLGGATLGGTLTAAAHHGVATFTGLTIDRAGSYRITAYTDPLTTTVTAPVTVAVPPTTPVTVAVPPTVVAERPIFAGPGRRKRVVGYELDFSTAMDPARAASPADYTLTQFQRRGRRLVAQPVGVRAAYDPGAHRVTLTLAGRPKFARGGRLVVLARPPTGLTDAAGAPLDGGDRGAFGDDGTFVIGRRGTTIAR